MICFNPTWNQSFRVLVILISLQGSDNEKLLVFLHHVITFLLASLTDDYCETEM